MAPPQLRVPSPGESSGPDGVTCLAVMDMEKRASTDGSAPASLSSPSWPDVADADAERRLLRKIDLHVYPILVVIYMLSFLDRINISNARIQGLEKGLNLQGNMFNIALFVYFVPYILLEIPSNMIIHKVRPSWYLAGLMVCWGLVNMCMGFVKSWEALVALRFLLGVFEAGVMPGIVYLTSMYYKRHEFQTRMSLFFCSTLIGGAFGGLLAFAISKLGGYCGLAAWQWIFIIEGGFTVVVAFFAVFLIVDWPDYSNPERHFLTPDELNLLKYRLASDGAELARMDTLNRFACYRILHDWKIWLASVAYMGIGTTGYAITFFMPSILSEFGWVAAQAQIYTIPVYAASAVAMIVVARLSDRLRHRYGFILAGALVSSVGYVVLLAQTVAPDLPRSVKYGAVFLIAIGGYTGTPMTLTWLANNVSGKWKRAFSSGIQVTVGNVAGIIASNIFLDVEKPTYVTGYGTALGMTWLGVLAATALVVGLAVENRKRIRGERDWRLEPEMFGEEDVGNMGDWHPSFRFTL